MVNLSGRLPPAKGRQRPIGEQEQIDRPRVFAGREQRSGGILRQPHFSWQASERDLERAASAVCKGGDAKMKQVLFLKGLQVTYEPVQ